MDESMPWSIRLEKERITFSETKPVQQVLMWRTFARLSKAIMMDSTSTSTTCWEGNDTESIEEANHLAEITVQNQQIMDALMKSIAEDGSKVPV
mmetsp:Transcript_30665/g.70664  ORF Transcript_30665/g.70664 Transcript_30665/m.70664 type:complete len:94 (+) Transcript_30665:594-875(+)